MFCLLHQQVNLIFIFGIEMKSWYLLSKEGEPSLRYGVSEQVPTLQDLLVVVPWVLSNVLSGVPVVYEPYIAPARYIDILQGSETSGGKTRENPKPPQ